MPRIESLIVPKAKPTRTVRVFGVDYVFQILVPGRYIADVADPEAAAALIATGAYREFTDQVASTLTAPKPASAPPVAPVPAAEPVTAAVTSVATTSSTASAGDGAASASAAATPPAEPSAGQASDQSQAPAGAKGEVDPATEEAAKLLLSGHPNSVKKQALTAPAEVLEAALAIEKADKRPRASVVEALTEALAKLKA